MSDEQKELRRQYVPSAHTCRSRGPTPRFPSIESVWKKKERNKNRLKLNNK